MTPANTAPAPFPGRAARLRGDEWLFLLWVAAVPLARLWPLYAAGQVVTLADLAFVAAVGAWAWAALRGRTPVVRSRWAGYLGLYLAALGVAVVYSADPARSLVKWITVVYLAASAGLAHQQISRSGARPILWAWLLGLSITLAAGAAALVCYYAGWLRAAQWLGLTGHGSLPPGEYPRLRALFFNPNMLCNYLIVSVGLLAAARAEGILGRAAGRLLMVGSVGVALLSLSPGLGGLALLGGLWAWLRRRAGAALIAGLLAAGLILAAAGLSPAALPERLATSARVMTWQTAWRIFLAHPLTGQGPGLPLPTVYHRNASGHVEHLTDAHNIWLSLAAQGGLPAVAAFALLCAAAWRICGSAEKTAPLPNALAAAFAGALLYHGLTGSFEDARHLWLLLGWMASLR